MTPEEIEALPPLPPKWSAPLSAVPRKPLVELIKEYGDARSRGTASAMVHADRVMAEMADRIAVDYGAARRVVDLWNNAQPTGFVKVLRKQWPGLALALDALSGR
jgi:hypothetical protein